VLLLAGAVLPVALGHGVAGLVAGLVTVGAIRLVTGIAGVVSVLPPPDDRSTERLLLGMLTYALPLGVALAVSICNRFVDKWFIAVLHPDQFGVYAVAAQEVPLLAVLPYAGGTALVTTLVAAFQMGDHGSAREVWLRLTATMSLVVVPLSVALVLLAPELIVLVFGPGFESGVLPFQIFTLITAHRVAEYGMLLRAAGRTRALLQVAGITLVANTVLAGIGARLGGMTGSAIGTLFASAIGWMWALRWIARTLGVHVRSAFAWRVWTTAMLGTGIAAAAGQLAADATDAGLGGRLAVKLAIYGTLAAIVLGAARRRRWANWGTPPLSAVSELRALEGAA
jgi:PST family polysaccharide transporter